MQLNAEQIIELMRRAFPDAYSAGFRIDALSEESITVVWEGAASETRPGGTISGPAMMTLVDTAAYFLVLAHIGPETLAVTTNLNINFLRKPTPSAMTAKARMLKLGKRLIVTDVELFVEAETKPVAHATVTYSVPPRRD